MLKELFNNAAMPLYPKKKKLRPLGIISDFVTDEMPGMKPDADRLRSIVDVVRKLDIQLDDAGLAILDIKMLHNFCTVAAVETKDHRFELLRTEIADVLIATQQKIGREPVCHLTYQDIILNNPPEDMRTFLIGPEGRSESDFYRGHQLIEARLQSAIDALLLVRQGVDMEKNLKTTQADIRAVKEGMFSFRHDLKKEHFTAFKPFFSTNPYTGEKGPSGAFTAKIPCVDILLFGHDTPVEEMAYLKDNKKYFPPHDFEQTQKFHAMKVNLFEALNKNGASERCYELADAVARDLLSFRHDHMGAVLYQIGKGGQGSAEGNGLDKYLQSRIKNMQGAILKMEL